MNTTELAIEHVAGHHRNVATPSDPATSRLGESFWRFFPRTVLGGIASAYELEAARVNRKGLPLVHYENRFFAFTLMQIGFLFFLGSMWGGGALLYAVCQAFVAIWLLEVVNYVEHYGLLRNKLENGKYESVKPVHSWNSDNTVTNYFLFNLQRHSDHHYKPGRRYHLLRHFDESPQLPTGYAGMILLALFPPVWRMVMDPLVEANKMAKSK